MSTASKITLAVTTVATLGIIVTVHNNQVQDRTRLREGIFKDEERQKKKIENQHHLVQQQELAKLYKKAEQDKPAQAPVDQQ